MPFYRAVIEIQGIRLHVPDIGQSDTEVPDSRPIAGLFGTVVARADREEYAITALAAAGLAFWERHEFSRFPNSSSSFECSVATYTQIGYFEYVWLTFFSKMTKGSTYYREAELLEC